MQVKASDTAIAHVETRNLQAVTVTTLLDLFPFAVIITPTMSIMGTGPKLVEFYHEKGTLIGENVCEVFVLRRPKGFDFTYDSVSIEYNLNLD